MAAQNGLGVSPTLDTLSHHLGGTTPSLGINGVTVGGTSPMNEIDRRYLANNAISVVGESNINEFLTRCAFDPAMVRVGAEMMVQQVGHNAANYSNRRKHMTKYVSDQAQIDELQRNFPQFTIVSGTDIPSVGHPYARETRMLEHREIYELDIRYNNDIRLAEGYDVHVRDIGGNPAIHDIAGRCKVHCCCPVLDVKDTIRFSNFKDYVSKRGIDSRVSLDASKVSTAVIQKHPVVSDYISSYPKLVCHKLGQRCHVKSNIVTLIHSTYDMTMDDIGDCFDMAECERAYAVFLFNPRMFLEDQGELGYHDCFWKKYKYHNSTMISFSFKHGASEAYTHDFKNYSALVKSAYLKTPGGRVYAIEKTLRNYSLKLVFHLAENGFIAQRPLMTRMPIDDGDSVFVATWWHSTVVVGNKIVPLVIETTKGFLQKVRAYAGQLNDNKFNVDNLKKFALANNSTVVVGSQFHKGPEHSVEEVMQLVVAVYLTSYDLNYESSQTLKAFIDDSNWVRKINSAGWFQRMLYKMFCDKSKRSRDEHPLISRNGEYVLSSGDDSFKSYEEIINEARRDKMSILDKIESLFPEVKKKYPVYFVKERYFTLTQAVEYGLVKSVTPSYTYAAGMSTDAYMNSAPSILYSQFTEAMKSDPYIREIMDVVSGSSGLVSDKFKSSSDCCGLFSTEEVPGDGDCFFHCLIKALNLSISPASMRERLSRSKYVNVLCSTLSSDHLTVDVDKRLELMNRLLPVEDPRDSSRWANDTVLVLAALEYSITICVHEGLRRFKYNGRMSVSNTKLNSGTVVHLSLVDKHFNLSVDNVSSLSPILLEVELEDEGAMMPQELDLVDDVMDTVSVRDNVSREIVEPKSIYLSVYEYTNSHCPFNKLDKYGYSSFYGPMLYTAVKDLNFTPGFKVLDVDRRNMSSLQMLCDNEFDGNVLTVTSLQSSMRSAVAHATSRVYARKTLWSSADSYDARMRTIRRLFSADETYNLITINPAYYSDKIGRIDSGRHFEHVKRLILLLSRLEKGGSAVIAMPFPFDQYVGSVTMYLKPIFEKMSVVVPSVQPIYLTWWFLKCEGFLGPEYIIGDLVLQTIPVVPASYNGFFDSIQDTHSNLLSEELDRINLRGYHNPSRNWVERMRSMVPTRQLEFEAGFDSSVLPDFTTHRAPRKLPEFGKSWIEKKYGTYSKIFDKRFFRGAVKDFSAEFRNCVLCLIGDPVEYLRDGCSNDEDSEFLKRYSIAMMSNPLPILKLKLVDVNKSITTSHFYDMSVVSKTLIRKIKSLFVNEDECRPVQRYPVNTDLFSPKGILPSEVYIPISHEKFENETSVDYESAVDYSAGGSDGADSGVFWSDKKISTDVNSNLELAMTEYKDCATLHVEKVKNNLVFTLKTLLGFRDIVTGDAKTVQRNLRPYVEQHKDFVFKYQGKYVFGADVPIGRYVCEYELTGANSSLQYNFVKVEGKKHLPKNFIYSSDLKVLMECDHLEAFNSIDHKPKVDVSLIQAGPGCGKTHAILEQLVESASNGKHILAVMKNKENVDSARSRLSSMIRNLSIDQKVSRTLSERIVSIDNVLKSPVEFARKYPDLDKCLVDEVITQPAGKIGFLAKNLRARTMMCYGDVAQIPWSCRLNDFEPRYSEVANVLPITGFLNQSFRCPGDICYFISTYYAGIARALGMSFDDPHSVISTKSEVKGVTIKLQQITSIDSIPVHDKLQLLPFTQADKELLVQKFGSKVLPIHTVHEYQGNENPDVALVRLSPHKNTDCPGDDGAFGSENHIVSAISRHTRKSVYYTVNVSDKLSKIINDINLNYPKWKSRKEVKGDPQSSSTIDEVGVFNSVVSGMCY